MPVEYTEEQMSQCGSMCPKHNLTCELRKYQQASFRYHGHKQPDGRMCIWPKETVSISANV